jgi:ELWxxDGT repeat protein
VIFQNSVYFFAEDGTGRESLWRSDGTAPGTVRVHEVAAPDQPRTAHEPTVVGDRFFFTAWSESTGQELWISDGTADGTRLLKDVRPGPEGSTPRHLTAVAGRLIFTADDGVAGQELWTSDGTVAGTGRLSDVAPGAASSAPEDLTPAGERLFFSADDGTHGRELWALDTAQIFVHCAPSPDRLCLDRGRFEVTVDFKDQHNGGRQGHGIAVADSDRSGFFWFFSPANLELAVKVLDGTAENGHFWVFFGSLSEVEYDVTVTDHRTGSVKTYHNPPGTFCGQADLGAFPSSAAAPEPAPAIFAPPPTAAAAEGACVASERALCLHGGRFQVEARWRNPLDGSEGPATAVPRTDETGSFWFFSPDNVELLVKALDGRPLNGKFWIFYGALSNVEYWVTVTDTETGAVKTYHNPPGTYCGMADPGAF